MDVTVHGVPAHSGLAPEKGRSAVAEMCYKVLELEASRDIERGKLINCGMVSGGIGENTVPGEAKISIGIRFPSLAIRDEILADIRSATERVHIEGTKAEMNVRMMMESMDTTDGVMELFEHIRKVAGECGYGEVHRLRWAACRIPARWCQAASRPCAAWASKGRAAHQRRVRPGGQPG